MIQEDCWVQIEYAVQSHDWQAVSVFADALQEDGDEQSAITLRWVAKRAAEYTLHVYLEHAPTGSSCYYHNSLQVAPTLKELIVKMGIIRKDELEYWT